MSLLYIIILKIWSFGKKIEKYLHHYFEYIISAFKWYILIQLVLALEGFSRDLEFVINSISLFLSHFISLSLSLRFAPRGRRKQQEVN